MTKLTFETLESMRIAQYAVGLPCTLCDTGNNTDAINCRHCHAPMALSHQGGKRRTLPKLISVMGPPESGKTTYLGVLLDTLSRQSQNTNILLCGAASISLQQQVISRLAYCEFPEPTSWRPENWHWVHAQVAENRHRRLEIAIPDIAGQWWLVNSSHSTESEIAHAILAKSSAILMLIDARRLDAGDSEPDFLAMKMLSTCHANFSQYKNAPIKIPVAFLFTKAENCPNALVNPAEFARLRAPGMYKLAKQFISSHAFFATSMASAEGFEFSRHGKRHTPLRIEPRRIPDAFHWLIQQL
jgi:hypothetical protein